jgi:hypothetical protein
LNEVLNEILNEIFSDYSHLPHQLYYIIF